MILLFLKKNIFIYICALYSELSSVVKNVEMSSHEKIQSVNLYAYSALLRKINSHLQLRII